MLDTTMVEKIFKVW